MQIISFYFERLDYFERIVLALLAGSMLAAAVLEVFAASLIAGFTALVASPEALPSDIFPPALRDIVHSSLPINHKNQLTVIAALSLLAVTAKNAIQAANLYFLTKLAMLAEARLGEDLLRAYATVPYSLIYCRDPEDLAQTVRWRGYYGRHYLTGALGLASNIMVVAMLVIYLVTTTTPLAAAVVAALALLSLFATRTLRATTEIVAQQCLESERALNAKTANFACGLREIRLTASSGKFIRSIAKLARTFATVFSKRQVSLRASSWVTEIVGLIALFATAIMLVVLDETQNIDVTATAALIVVVSWRILRAVVENQRDLAKVRMAIPFVAELMKEWRILSSNVPAEVPTPSSVLPPDCREVAFHSVDFCYPQKSEPALKGVSFVIEKQKLLGITGRSGAGKSTIANLVMGLFLPSKGEISISGHTLGEHNAEHWRRRVGYLSQVPYFIDGSLAENIAFGEEYASIDFDRVRRCSRLAQIDFFDVEHLDGRIVHGGQNLSGGQKVRVALARALYRARDLLILDEPTSALDIRSATCIRETLRTLKGFQTTLIISHDRHLLELCDKVVWLDEGVVRAVDVPTNVVWQLSASWEHEIRR